MLEVVTKKGEKVLKGVTPRGEFQWVFITGEGQDNYNEDGKEYKASIVFEGKNADLMEKWITNYWEEVATEADVQGSLGPHIGVLVKEPGENESTEKFIAASKLTDKHKKSGRVSYTFKTKTTWPDGKPVKIGVFNSKREMIKFPEGTSIGNGSEGHLQVFIRRGTRGRVQYLSMYLVSLQLLKFVEYSSQNDFEEVDDPDAFEGFPEQSEDGGVYKDAPSTEDQEDDDIPL